MSDTTLSIGRAAAGAVARAVQRAEVGRAEMEAYHENELRVSPENPTTTLSNPDAWMRDAFGAAPSGTGIAVTERRAMNQATVFSCVRILAHAMASLPFPTYKRLAGGGKERAMDHPLYQMLQLRPNPEMSAFTFRETAQAHQEIWGNAYAEIERNGRGDPIALWPLLPDRTYPVRKDGVKYYVTTINGEQKGLPAEDVLHIPGLGFDGLSGYSVIAMMRQSVGLALATDEYGARFFGNGSKPGGILKTPNKLTDEAKKRLKTQWEVVQGGLSNAHRVAVLEDGLEWQAMGVDNNDAQFLETKKFSRSEIAGWFGVPANLVNDNEKSAFANVEQQSLNFIIHALRPRCIRIEQAVNWDLLSQRERVAFFAEHALEGLLRGDMAARASFYKEMFGIGVYSANMILEKENESPVEGGDQRFIPMNMIPLERASELADAQIKSASSKNAPAPAGPGGDPAGKVAPDAMGAARAFERVFRKCADDVIRREVSAARRALKKSNGARDGVAFRTWLDEFYAEQPGVIRKAFEPAVTAFLEVIGGESSADAVDCVTRLATAETERSLSALREALAAADDAEASVEAILAGWEATRAGEVAARSLTLLAA